MDIFTRLIKRTPIYIALAFAVLVPGKFIMPTGVPVAHARCIETLVGCIEMPDITIPDITIPDLTDGDDDDDDNDGINGTDDDTGGGGSTDNGGSGTDDSDGNESSGTEGTGDNADGGSADDDESADGIPTCKGMTATIYISDTGQIVGGPNHGDMFTGRLKGSERADVIVGTGGDDVIDGRGGDDLICGRAGQDSIDGGNGDDTVSGGEGDDFIEGGIGNDILCGDGGNDAIEGDTGDDILCGGNGDDDLAGDSGKDKLDGGSGQDVLDGKSGSDICLHGEEIAGCEDTTTPIPECGDSGNDGGVHEDDDGDDNADDDGDDNADDGSDTEEGNGDDNGEGNDTSVDDDNGKNGTTIVISSSDAGSEISTGGGGGARTKIFVFADRFLQRFYSKGYAKPQGPYFSSKDVFDGQGKYLTYVPGTERRTVAHGSPFSGVERRSICGVVKVMDRNDEASVRLIQSNWASSMLAENLGREVRDIRGALRDPSFCDGIEPSVLQYVGQKKEVEVEAEVSSLIPPGPLTFHLDAEGMPLLEEDSTLSEVWNNCVRSYVTYRPDGKIYNCRRFYVKNSKWGGRKWIHPTLGIPFGWNYITNRLVLPGMYGTLVVMKKEEEIVLDESDDAKEPNA